MEYKKESLSIEYEVGDKVQFKNLIFIMDAEILEVYENGDPDLDDEFKKFDYYIKFWDYEGNDEDVLVTKKDLVGFTKGTKKYLKQELDKLIKIYSKDEILECIKQ